MSSSEGGVTFNVSGGSSFDSKGDIAGKNINKTTTTNEATQPILDSFSRLISSLPRDDHSDKLFEMIDRMSAHIAVINRHSLDLESTLGSEVQQNIYKQRVIDRQIKEIADITMEFDTLSKETKKAININQQMEVSQAITNERLKHVGWTIKVSGLINVMTLGALFIVFLSFV